MAFSGKLFYHQIGNTVFGPYCTELQENRQQMFLTSWSVGSQPNENYFDCLHHVTEIDGQTTTNILLLLGVEEHRTHHQNGKCSI